MTVTALPRLLEDCSQLICKSFMTYPPFSFHDPVSKPVKVVLGTVSDGTNHTFQNVGVHVIPPFPIPNIQCDTLSQPGFSSLKSANRAELGPFSAGPHRQASGLHSERISRPRPHKAVASRETVGGDAPSWTSIGVGYPPDQIRRNTAISRLSISSERWYCIRKTSLAPAYQMMIDQFGVVRLTGLNFTLVP